MVAGRTYTQRRRTNKRATRWMSLQALCKAGKPSSMQQGRQGTHVVVAIGEEGAKFGKCGSDCALALGLGQLA